MKGMVLEGGAMRGLFTAGVIDVMMENEIDYDGIIGVSAGAAFGCNYKSKQIGRVLRYNKRFAHDKQYCSIRSLIKTGDLYGADYCYHRLPNEFDIMDAKTYRENPLRFWCVVTDTETGQPVYHELKTIEYEELEWMRASASMPIASKPVLLDGHTYLDGGISDSIPVQFMIDKGFDRIVVVLTQPDGYVKKATSPLVMFLLRKYPALQSAMERRPEFYNATLRYIKELEHKGRIFVIRPPEALNIGSTEHDTAEMQRVYDIGRREMERQMAPLKAYLQD